MNKEYWMIVFCVWLFAVAKTTANHKNKIDYYAGRIAMRAVELMVIVGGGLAVLRWFCAL